MKIGLAALCVLLVLALWPVSVTRENKIPYPEKIVFAGSDAGHFWFITTDGEDYAFWRESHGKIEKQTTVRHDIGASFWGLPEQH